MQALQSAVLMALSTAAPQVASYSMPPAGLVVLLHPSQNAPLERTAKGSVVRRSVERRFEAVVSTALRKSAAIASLWHDEDEVDGGGSGPATGAASGAESSSLPHAEARRDSLGLATLAASRELSAAEARHDALIQHLKVVLLFAVLLRHLQRFTVRTCHAWLRVAPTHAATCVVNNLVQTGAAEGLAFLSGVALTGRDITIREVASPLVLLLAFRHALHPLLEWALAYRVDIGTAHLWFILMVGLGRMLCWPLSRLPRRASRTRLAIVTAVFAWRLLRAPTHIGAHSKPLLRRLLFFLLFGDRNYLQIIHNVPLVLLGFVCPDVMRLAGRRLARLLPPTVRRACGRRGPEAPRRALPVRWLVSVALVALTFVADPLYFGVFVRKSKALEERPMVVYARSALRVGALAAVLPRRPTALTSAGRSQLLAYLLHDAVFSVGALVVAPTVAPVLPPVSEWAGALIAASNGGVGATLVTATVACGECVVYAALCLSVQLALSHPRLLTPLAKCTTCAWTRAGSLQAVYGKMRFTALHAWHSHGGGAMYKRVPGEASAA